MRQSNFEDLEQCDYLTDENLESIIKKYSNLIGSFLIKFSCLEHDLNLTIAEFIHDDAHEMGYVVIEKLTFKNKIDLFYKMYLRLESIKDKNNKTSKQPLRQIKNQFELICSFRNNIVHANWQSLTKDNFVRTKIIVDNQEGYVKFKKIKITPKMIKEKIKEIDKLMDKIFKYTEIAFQF